MPTKLDQKKRTDIRRKPELSVDELREWNEAGYPVRPMVDVHRLWFSLCKECGKCSIPTIRVGTFECPDGKWSDVEKSNHFAGAHARWVHAGKPKRPKEEVEQIIENHCKKCDQYESRECLLVCRTCSDPEKVLEKVKWSTEVCPEGKWSDAGMVDGAVGSRVDVVIPLSNKSLWGDGELRYALRSLEKNLLDLGRVFIVGHKPSWLTNVEHIPADDIYKHGKDANLFRKVLMAIDAGCSRLFIRQSDDQCLLKPMYGRELLPRYANEVKENPDAKDWWARMERTREALAERGYPTMFYDCHMPILCETEAFRRAAGEFDWATSPSLCINTLYCNAAGSKATGSIPLTGATLSKHELSGTSDEIVAACQNPERISFNYNGKRIPKRHREALHKMFPERSRFELSDIPSEKDAALVSAIARGKCKDSQYRHILSEIEKRCPCNVLVFGCGADSRLWNEANAGGRTLFIENNCRWASMARNEDCEVIETTYNSKRGVGAIDGPVPEELQEALSQKWDVVFIDAPRGNKSNTPGRELPIRWTSRLPGEPLVFLHDYNRDWESRCAKQYFKTESAHVVGKSLGVWQLGEGQFEIGDALEHAIAHGWCSEDNYREIIAEIEKNRPCNMLVFGCGHDSKLWHKANAGGRTLFIEDKRRWVRLARNEGCEVIRTSYESTQGVDAPDVPPPDELQEAFRQEWDIVFIDGPRRNQYGNPGRELPVRWTSRLPGSPIVFMHDYTRRWEGYCAKKYFKSEPLRVIGSQLDDGSQLAVWQLDNRQELSEVPDHAWTYWDGACPAWIELCLETMRRNIPGINILTPTTFARLYAEHRGPDDPYDLLSTMPALSRACQRSNIIRTWLLKTFGGTWIDADCIVLSDVRELCKKHMAGKDLVTYKYDNKFSVDALLMSRPNGQVISECARQQQEVLQDKRKRLNRQSLGPPILQRAIAIIGEREVGVIPTELVDPARGGRRRQYLAEGKLPKGCACVMLRAKTGKNKLLWTRDQWLSPECYLSTIFRRALGMNEKNDNGVLIISIGRKRRQLLWDCLAGLQRHNPDVPVHVVSDVPVDVPFTWADPKYQNFLSRHYKTQAHKLSPFSGVTLLIDDDTIVNKPLPPLDELIGDGDVALVKEPTYPTVERICNRKGSGKVKYREEQNYTREMCQADQPHYNSGVFAFRRTQKVIEMFDCWHEEWLRYQSLDQLALCRAMANFPMQVKEIDGSEFNCHNDLFDYKNLDPTIFHFSRSSGRNWFYDNHYGPANPHEKYLEFCKTGANRPKEYVI
jgi:glucuronoxylan 4-O-methyltransferase